MEDAEETTPEPSKDDQSSATEQDGSSPPDSHMDLWGVESRIEFGVAAFSIAAGALPSIAQWAWVLVGSPVDLEGGLERMRRVRASGCFRSPLATVLIHDYAPNNYTPRRYGSLEIALGQALGQTYYSSNRRGIPLTLHPRILNAAVIRPIFNRQTDQDDSHDENSSDGLVETSA